MLFRSGWNAKQVQMVLGHHSPAFTLGTYVHLIPDDLLEPVFPEMSQADALVRSSGVFNGDEYATDGSVARSDPDPWLRLEHGAID